MDLNASGGVLDYDCATGAIHEPLIPDDEGHMIAVGTHSPGHGGPGMEGEVIPQLPARYEGIVRNDHLLLTVTLIDSAKVVGTFDLRYGRAGTVNKCL